MDLIVLLAVALLGWAMLLQTARSSRPLGFWRAWLAGVAAGAVCTFSWWGVWVALTGTPLTAHKDFPPFTMLFIYIWLVTAFAFQSLCRRDGRRGCRHILLILLGTCPVQLALILSIPPMYDTSGFLGSLGVLIGGVMVGIALIWTILAAIALLFIRARLPKPGLCTTCGYDLRGLPEPRCPECGTPFTPQTAERPQPEPMER